MKAVVAVSGGIDSVVLLDILVKTSRHNLVIAHFDHGMRDDSSNDAEFVRALANKYQLDFFMAREELAGRSEDKARERRYEFLFELCNDLDAQLVTAHHLDDLVETISLNILRGTGWKGLATMSDSRIMRPLLKRTKSELTEYALKNHLEWVEDETNRQDKYQRNKIRKKLTTLPFAKKQEIYELWVSQHELRRKVNREIEDITSSASPIGSRYFMVMADESSAKEILYQYILNEFGISLLSSQVERMLMAIKVGKLKTCWQIGQGIQIELTASSWRAFQMNR